MYHIVVSHRRIASSFLYSSATVAYTVSMLLQDDHPFQDGRPRSSSVLLQFRHRSVGDGALPVGGGVLQLVAALFQLVAVLIRPVTALFRTVVLRWVSTALLRCSGSPLRFPVAQWRRARGTHFFGGQPQHCRSCDRTRRA